MSGLFVFNIFFSIFVVYNNVLGMGILSFFIGKFFIFTFILAAFYLVREVWRFIRGLNTGEYELDRKSLLWVGICIAHIATTLITGFII